LPLLKFQPSYNGSGNSQNKYKRQTHVKPLSKIYGLYNSITVSIQNIIHSVSMNFTPAVPNHEL